jgi:putative hydrolase of the HAD superfamily
MIKAAVFDIGNVVWAYKPFCDQVFNEWAKLLNISFDDFFQKYLKVYIDLETDNLKLDDFIKQLDPNLDPQPFYAKLDEVFGNQKSYESYLNQEVIGLIKKLKDSNIKVGCLSNMENYFLPYHERYLLSLFDFPITSCQIKCRKPDPKTYEKIFDYVTCQANEVVFIDDRLENVEGAVKLGLNGILFQDYQQLLNDIFVLQS